MFSIIVCSIKPDWAAALEANIARTIGLPFEMLVCDNRGTGKGICQVYNEAAARARYDLLCFVHEDVAFHTEGWGEILARALRQPDCGVVGFAGSRLKPATMTGWYTRREDLRCHYLQGGGRRVHTKRCNPQQEPLSEVITLDGMCLFVRREVWDEVRFDEQRLKGFHCYDLDFTLACAQRYRNYVCQEVLIEHFSVGAYSESWYEAMRQLHAKWQGVLPCSVEAMSPEAWRRCERLCEAEFMRLLMQKGLFGLCDWAEVRTYWRRYPLRWRSWQLLLQWMKYRYRHRKR